MKSLYTLVILICFCSFSIAGTTGKISGQITDSETGETLPGVNVFLEGTSLGAATDVDGFYYILNIPPATYNLQVSYVGYADHTVQDVKVEIDLTTNINLALKSEILTTEAVVIVAQRDLVQKDVAASQRSITSEQIEALPFTSVSEVVGMEAGVTSTLEIRGSQPNEVLFLVDGISFRDDRNNRPIMSIPLSAVQELSVQSGGFGAEFSNVRSGVVNVVTKEGNPNNYEGTVTFRMSPAQPKHFGMSPFDPNSYWLRPYLDPDVCWTGTSGEPFEDLNNNENWDEGESYSDVNNDGNWTGWDKYTKTQYKSFDGWNKISQDLLNDNDPSNDLSPEALKRLWQWHYRKQGDIEKPDYYIDAGFGGPVPLVSRDLGNLRFFASFQREREMYLFRLATEDIIDQTWMLKVTSDLQKNMKLSLLSTYGELYATSLSRSGGTGIFETTTEVAEEMDRKGFTVPWRIYTDIYYAPTQRYSHTFALKFQHILSPSTFYDMQIKKVGRKYFTAHGPLRNFEKKYEIVPGFFVDEAPVGFLGQAEFTQDGSGSLALGGAVSTSRDKTEINTYSLKADLVSQFDNHNQLKAGFELTYNDYALRYGMENEFLPDGNRFTKMDQDPLRATFYFEDKIEYEGFTTSAGLIIDYSDPADKWFVPEDPYDPDFYTANYDSNEADLFRKKVKGQGLTFSPRLGISHPITENSKLYFNYGHFRQIPTSEDMFRVQRQLNQTLEYLGDPTLPFSKTISYELGYDHALFDEYLFHVAAYYKDISDQQYWIRYYGMAGGYYSQLTNRSYEDIRGLEIDLTKVYGRWITGNINYEYRVGTNGYFGIRYNYENPKEQKDYLAKNIYQEKPRPRPRIKSSIDFHTPIDFGPKFGGQNIIGSWHFNLISRWTSGLWDEWNPNTIPGIEHNFQWNDYHNFELKITKVFPFENFDIKLFVDINNLTNHKYFSREAFVDKFDYEAYMKSLHLPASIAGNLGYEGEWIPGDDNPGDYRKPGVEWVPMRKIDSTDPSDIAHPDGRAVYYDASTSKYMKYDPNSSTWSEMPKGELQKILDDKAYIDMPNQKAFMFLNPRNIFFGLTFNYHL
jgi:outer membrane receptor protein involved in Fe transport